MTSLITDTGPSIKLPKVDFLTPPKTKKKSSSKKKKSSGHSKSVKAPAITDDELILKYVTAMYAGYTPKHETYTEATADELSKGISAWLRPEYERAIQSRKKMTESYRAEVDADAVSRGMGASTYVSSVKSRQSESEAADIEQYETGYAAQLAKYLSEAVQKEKDRSFEVKTGNTERDHAAYMSAYEAALSLFLAYKQKDPGSITIKPGDNIGSFSSLKECENYVSGLPESERKALFDGSDAKSLLVRSRIIEGIGATNFLYLQQQYPGK